MWWLGIPVAVGLGKLLYDAVTKTDETTPSQSASSESALIKNLRRLRRCTRSHHPHRIAFMGQPGAGKSTILKKLSKGRVKPEPAIGTHTDATDWAESTDVTLLSAWDDYVVADVPGYDTSTHPASAFIEFFPFSSFSKIMLVMRGKVRQADVLLYQKIRASGVPVVVVRSFAESLDAEDRKAVREDFCRQFSGLASKSIIFVSSRDGKGLEKLKSII